MLKALLYTRLYTKLLNIFSTRIKLLFLDLLLEPLEFVWKRLELRLSLNSLYLRVLRIYLYSWVLQDFIEDLLGDFRKSLPY